MCLSHVARLPRTLLFFLATTSTGSLQASTRARMLETACKTGDYTAVPDLIEGLSESVSVATQGLRAWLKAKENSPSIKRG